MPRILLLPPTSTQLHAQAYPSSSLHFKQQHCPAMSLKMPTPQTEYTALNSQTGFSRHRFVLHAEPPPRQSGAASHQGCLEGGDQSPAAAGTTSIWDSQPRDTAPIPPLQLQHRALLSLQLNKKLKPIYNAYLGAAGPLELTRSLACPLQPSSPPPFICRSLKLHLDIALPPLLPLLV